MAIADLLAANFPALAHYCPILPGISAPQAAALLTPSDEQLYGGAAGGGKSSELLMAALQYVDTPGYAAIILRRTFPQLDQPGMLIPMAREWLGPTDAVYHEQRHEWRFPSGAILRFGHVKDETAALNYQGGGYHFVGFDELTQFTQNQYLYIAFSRARRDTRMMDLGIPIRRHATSNPGGIGHAWVKRRFVNPETREPGAIFIPAKVADNPGLDVESYSASLQHLGPVLVRQLLDGDWGAFEGAAFHQFNDKPDHLQVISGVELEDAWERFECMDFGINHPTAWYAIAVDHDRNLIVFDSIYTDVNEGLPSKTAPRVLYRRPAWRSTRCEADPSINRRTGGLTSWGQPATIATEFEELGITLSLANNDPRAGYTRLREMIEPNQRRRFPDWHPRARELGAPRIFIVASTCVELVEQLAAAPLQPIDKLHAGEMIDPDWEGEYGHAVAALRYGALSRPKASEVPEETIDDPRAALLAKVEAQRDSAPKRRRDYDY